MELAKTNRINALFDFYEGLLTSKQMQYIGFYYQDDYSLGEIAENFAVSRQAVYDNIKRTEQTLENYEDKLHLYRDFLERNQKIDSLMTYALDHYQDDQTLVKLITDLEETED
ncbi:UPF0122 protein [Ligilactobacillus pabuli]|uniref:UPF0122 protein LPAF129_05750 n=1 Tax=Ligilactobacillus pabuli TaxID=2886039 RepID=A0ABQ5JIG3_9LACO|nr:putative DNA-binding protein [Ligilactobacillus pabuli]GKS80890.1 UPF0122 protein [Ligilactobacillus pabuli]HIW89574.1 putative DNA-binding protein [Candidatus Ligilactobacillus excrementipullorum]